MISQRDDPIAMTIRPTIRELIETLALAVFVVLLLHTTLQNYRVDGPSMEPFLVDRDRVLVDKVGYLEIRSNKIDRYLPWVDLPNGHRWKPIGAPKRGDVVVFHFPMNPDLDLVKSVIGEPRDVVEIVNGAVFVNGSMLEERYLDEEHRIDEKMAPVEVKPDNYFVMGDNRFESHDSRHWGTVPSDQIIGRVWVKYWPSDVFGNITEWLW